MKKKFNNSKTVIASIVAGLALILTAIGNINDIIQFFQTLIDFSNDLSISKKVLAVIIVAVIIIIVATVVLVVILKNRKQKKEEKPMLDFLNEIDNKINNNIDYSYVKPFLSQSIENMMADTATETKMYNSEIMAAEKIDSVPYEAALAQKIARTDSTESCLKAYRLLREITDSWTVFLNNDKKIVSYWVFVALKKDKYDEISSGKINEMDIELQDAKFIDVSGRYKGYLLLSGTSGNCKTQKIRKELYDSWIKHLEELANDNIFFDEISSMVGSEWGNSSLQNIGMEYYAEYDFGGKMYKYDLKNIDSIEYLNKFYPQLAEKYRKEYEGA